MVCEVPRQRQLVVSRRGSFFEDPFFRDAWDDYSYAVRRIVDRFNSGWVTSPQRLHDSQYHSLYRTLRTARLNYSAHSARFKEEGNAYKLVMDVQEFIGGNITVRTAGGTVSVRGKVEVGADVRTKETAKDDEEDTHSVSGLSSSTKTLHRRFTLPPDADSERVESSLSRDAVLTVTIPKKPQTDVYIIPVRVEGEQGKGNVQSLVGAEPDAARLPGGVKRPSDTPLDRHRKKSQEETSNGSRRRRHRRDEEKGKEDKKRDKKEERNLRRKSKEYNVGEHPTKFRDAFRESTKTEELDSEKKNRTDRKEGDRKSSDDHRRSRRRESKYEEAREINIPVRLTEDNPSEKVFQPSSQHEPTIRHIEIEREPEISLEDHRKGDSKREKSLYQNGDGSERKKSEEILGDESQPYKRNSRRRSFPQRKLDQVDGKSLNLNLKSERRREIKPIHEVSDAETENNDQTSNHSNKMAPTKSERKEFDRGKEPRRKRKQATQPLSSHNDNSTTDRLITISAPSIDITTNEDRKDIPKVKEIGTDSLSQREELNDSTNLVNGVNGIHDSSKDSLETPKLSSRRPSSPISPGSRLVKVEEDPSLKEDCMFKDCWNDFSNTLQDVLARLQELSSELGQSKILATTPLTEQPPPFEEEGSSFDPPAQARAFSPSSETLPEGVSSPTSKVISAHSKTSDVGGVGGREGGTKDESRYAPSPWRAGHGCSEAYDLDARRKPGALEEEITTVAPKGPAPLPNGSPGQKGSNEASQNVSLAPRPDSLPLRNVASPRGQALPPGVQGEPLSSASRPTSLLLNEGPPGNLLETLRKNSPVEALQEDYLRRTRPEPPSEGKGRIVPVEVATERAVPVGGLRKEEERSAPLSPSDSQSNGGSDWSESASAAVSHAFENLVDSEEPRAGGASLNRRSSDGDQGKPVGLNDLSLGHQRPLLKAGYDVPRPGLAFAPNIDDASPESNLTDESESSSLDEGSQSSPTELLQKERALGDPSSVTPLADVTASAGSANGGRPEIPSDDAMGCERPLAPSARVPLVGAKRESPHFSRANKPHDLLLHDERGDADRGREAGVAMGGVFSRGRSAPSRTNTDSASDTSAATKSPSACPPSPSGRRVKQQTPHQEKPTTPSYVRTRGEAPKRQSGFAHVNSDNVRRMRDVWGSKQDPKAQVHTRPQKVPPSPTCTTSRRSSDGWGSPRTSECGSPRPHSVPSSERNKFSFRNSSSPSRGVPTSSSPKTSSGRLMKENSPARTNGSHSFKPPSSPHWDSPRRGSQASHKKGSPASASPSSKYSRDAKDSPLPSPTIDRKPKEDTGRRSSYEKTRKDSSSKTTSSPSVHKDRRSPPAEESPRSSKVHQKIFKRLRDANLQPDSETICFKEEESRYKMILDVEEFVPGEIEVLQDDRLLTVKGRVETRKSTGQRVVRTFERTFDIPRNSREEDIDSALSKDGILTIFVPKKRERIIKIELVD